MKAVAFVDAFQQFLEERAAMRGHPYYAVLAQDLAAALRAAASMAGATPEGP